MCSLTTLWDVAQSFSRLLWHHESGKYSNICRFNFLHLLFNKGIHMNISQKIFCSDILQLLSNGNKWFKSWPFLTLTYFQKILRPKRPVRATCVSLELFSIDWSHRWIPICCYSIHFWIYSKKKTNNFWYWAQGNSLLFNIDKFCQIWLYSTYPAQKWLG